MEIKTNENKKGRVITIVGCGGDRDNKKRPIMGNIATELSDYVILTNDNPRTEDEKKIMDDIVSGIKKDNYEIIYDRALAIRKGLELLNDNDFDNDMMVDPDNDQVVDDSITTLPDDVPVEDVKPEEDIDTDFIELD